MGFTDWYNKWFRYDNSDSSEETESDYYPKQRKETRETDVTRYFGHYHVEVTYSDGSTEDHYADVVDQGEGYLILADLKPELTSRRGKPSITTERVQRTVINLDCVRSFKTNEDARMVFVCEDVEYTVTQKKHMKGGSWFDDSYRFHIPEEHDITAWYENEWESMNE